MIIFYERENVGDKVEEILRVEYIVMKEFVWNLSFRIKGLYFFLIFW